jgi:hypothetical protein
MPDRNATDLRLGRDAHPPDEPTPADHGDQVAVAPDGGAGGWEAFDDPDAPTPPGTTPDHPEAHTPTVTSAPDGGAGGWEAFDDPNASDRDRPADSWAAPELASRGRVTIDAGSSSDASSLPADRQSPAEILQPGGELIGTPGTSTGIRELPGNQREAEELYERLSAGGREAAPPGYSGRAVELPDGGFVGLRLESKSGGPAIDVNIPGIEITRIHFDDKSSRH